MQQGSGTEAKAQRVRLKDEDEDEDLRIETEIRWGARDTQSCCLVLYCLCYVHFQPARFVYLAVYRGRYIDVPRTLSHPSARQAPGSKEISL